MYIYFRTMKDNYKKIRTYKRYLRLLKTNVNRVKSLWNRNRKDTFLECYLILSNRTIIDLESTFSLLKKGYYGSCYALCAIMTRSNKMLTALQADPSIRNKYLDEEESSYQTDKDFRKEFKEVSISKKIDNKFGIGTSFINEMDKTLHGSAFGSRKYYCKIFINEKGKKEPLLLFASFYERLKASGIINIMEAICLDNIGIFLEEYKDNSSFYDIKKTYFSYLKELGIISKEKLNSILN